MRAVIYARVSKDDRKDQRSVGEQEQECRDTAARLGWTVDQVFTDDDRSASRFARKHREDYAALVTYLETTPVGVLILWESSRGDRELERWARLLNLCRRRGVRIHVETHERTYNLDNARDWKTLAEDGVNNAYASEETHARILRTVRAQATKGLPHGKLPYGYRREYDDRGNFVAQVEHPEQAEIVRECARRVAAGESLYSIAQDLNAREIPAPRGGKWLPGQVKRLATNPRYIGQRVHRGVVVGDAVWDGIVEEDVYAECARRMADPRRYTTRDTSLKYLLTGILKCGVCGAKCRVIKNRGYFAYACFTSFCVSARTSKVEEFVTDMVIARLEQPDVLAALAARGDQNAAGADTEAKKLQARLDGFVDSAAEGKLTPAALARIEARLQPQIDEAKRRALVAPVPRLVREVAGPGARERWEKLTIGQQREIVDKLVELRVGRTVQSRRFDFHRLGESRWRNDERTWAEHWHADGVL